MNRFDVGVVVVTFVALALIAIIRRLVVPIVRYRITRDRLASHATLSAAIPEADRRNVELKDQTR